MSITLRYDELRVGLTFTEDVVAKVTMVDDFASLTSDYAPVHFDSNHAKKMGLNGTVLHGFLTISKFSKILGMNLPGPGTVIQSVKFDFISPVMCGACLNYFVTVEGLIDSVKAVKLGLRVSVNEKIVVKGSAVCVFKIQHEVG